MSHLERIKRECDVIIVVADARAPHTLYHFSWKGPKIFVLTKADLIPEDEKRLLAKKAILFSSKTGEGKRKLMERLKILASRFGRRIRVGVVGYPNAGKSSLINRMCARKKAKVSMTPGETKGVQWIKMSEDILFYDSPGVILRKKDEKTLAKWVAVSPDRVKDPEGVAGEIIEEIGKDRVMEVYGVEGKDPEEILLNLAKRRGFLLKGGFPDTERAGRTIIRDWQKGRLRGKVFKD